MTAGTLKLAKKRREEVRKIVYTKKGISEIEANDIRPEMRNIMHLASLTSLTMELYW